MKTFELRNPVHRKPQKLTTHERRQLWRITTNLTDKRQQTIEKFMRNSERGRLPVFNVGADMTRQITNEQMAKFLACDECVSNPAVFLKIGKKRVSVCARDWAKLSDMVIGWTENG